MTDERLAELEKLANEATPGPWDLFGLEDKIVGAGWRNMRTTGTTYYHRVAITDAGANAAFIRAARTAVPELLAEVQRLRAIVESLKIHVAVLAPSKVTT